MNRRFAFILGALVAVAVLAPAAQAAPRKATVTPTAPAKWTGKTATGFNATWFTDSVRASGQCGSDATNYFDDTLVKFTGTPSGDSFLKFRIDGFQPFSDFDLRVYRSDPSGEPIEYLGSPTGDITTTSPLGANDPRATAAGDYETKSADFALPGDYYLVRVVYFTVASDSYKGSV